MNKSKQTSLVIIVSILTSGLVSYGIFTVQEQRNIKRDEERWAKVSELRNRKFKDDVCGKEYKFPPTWDDLCKDYPGYPRMKKDK